MLAKIVKSSAQAEIAPLAFPVIGGAQSPAQSHAPFVVPDISQIASTHAPASFEQTGTEQPGAAHFEPFLDHSAQVDGIIEAARSEAAQIVARAEQDAAAIAEAAKEKAVQEVHALFEQEVAAKADEARLELARTIEQVSGLAETISARHEKDLVELALQIARKIVGREVTIDREIAFTLVKVSLSKLHNRAAVEIHLNPEDLAFVESHRERLDFRGSLALVEDKSVSLGGCLIHTETGDIDARIESQFDEIAHGLFA